MWIVLALLAVAAASGRRGSVGGKSNARDFKGGWAQLAKIQKDGLSSYPGASEILGRFSPQEQAAILTGSATGGASLLAMSPDVRGATRRILRFK